MKLLIILLLLITGESISQVRLNLWTEVYGTGLGEQLGNYVTYLSSIPNLPYRAAISKNGYTGLYILQNPSDTAVKRILPGENLHVGDLNGDGWKDVVLRQNSTVVIYWGTPTGIDTSNPTKLKGTAAFGYAICIGNIIGDSIPDLMIGDQWYPNSGASQGRVYIYKGGMPFDTIPAIILDGDSAYYTFGTDIAVGDINNDGFNDLIVRGMFQYGPEADRFNYVDIWYGGAPFDTVRDLRLRCRASNVHGLACFDANGDGIDDLLWTNIDSSYLSWVNVHYGRKSFSSIPDVQLRDPQWAQYGNVIANAGDMNGDGYDDIVVGAYSGQVNGFVFVYCGGPKIDQYFDAAIGQSGYSYFGWSVSSIGDVNGDGLADIIIGAPNYEFSDQRGYWGVYLGDTAIHPSGVKENPNLPGIFQLFQSYPNPFNPQTTIRYDLNESAYITLKIFNELGEEVSNLVDRFERPGAYQAIFDGGSLASGVYFYRLTAKRSSGEIFTDTKKIALIK